MLIKSRMGGSVDGFVANDAGIPAIALTTGFVPGESHGYPEFIVLLPVLIGTGALLSPAGAPALPLRLLRADRIFPDGSAELVYAPGS